MKSLAIVATVILAGVITYAVVAHAQPAGEDNAEPVKVDPKHYKLEFENDKVRILRISYAPGEKSAMYYHPDPVAVYVTAGKTRMTTPDGKSRDMPAKAALFSILLWLGIITYRFPLWRRAALGS